MAVSFPIPKNTGKSIFKIDTFYGADFTNSPANADETKSPNMVNMIRDVPGKVRKCMGYETMAQYRDSELFYANVLVEGATADYGAIQINDGLWTITPTSDIISIDDPDLFDQDILAAYYSYFNDPYIDMGHYMFKEPDLPDWIGVIGIEEVDVSGTNKYYLTFNLTSVSSSDEAWEDGILKLHTMRYLERQQIVSIMTEVTASDTSSTDYNAYMQNGQFRLKFKGAEGPISIFFNTANWERDDILNADLLEKWHDAYGDENILPYIMGENIPSYFASITIAWHNSWYGLIITTTANVPTSGYSDWMTFNLFNDPATLDVGENKGNRINGFHKLRSDEYGLVHAGPALIRNGVVLYDIAADHRSMSWEFDEHLYIVDGKKFLKYGLNSPTSDLKYRESKINNNVVINEEVAIVVKEFNAANYSLTLTQKKTNSANGRFEVSEDNKTITYYDTLTSVGQDIEYKCSWTYKKKSSSSAVTGTIATHHLIGISDVAEYEVVPVETEAHIPLLTISKDPNGGGTAYNDLNLLTPAFTERFLPKQNTDPISGQPTTWMTDYYMSLDDLDEVEPIVKKLNDETGEWEELEYGTDFTVDYETGCITFTTAPSYTGEDAHDRISITAYKTIERYADMINKCTIGTLFGIGGANDRLFLSGNPDYINYDWYCGAYQLPTEEQEDYDQMREDYATPTYFPDTGYATLGSSGSAIIGYSRVSNYLAAHKDKFERDQNIIIREGDLVESEPSFRIINTLQGAGAVAPYSFGYLATEPLFLTEQGVYAVTAQDITGEKYAQNRSYFLDGKLLEEDDLSEAYGCVHNDLYWLCLNNVAYILDGLQPIQTDKSMPYSTRQYVGFYRTNLPARVMWEDEGRLFFGTNDGKVCRFYKDKYDLNSYNDDGAAIECSWETPDIIGKLFFKNKTLRYVAVKLDSAIAASVNIYVMDHGLWRFVRTDHWRARFLVFSQLVFSKFTFSCDKTQRVLPTKLRVKKVDKFRLKLTNDQLNEPFALYDIGFEFVESPTPNYTR